MERNTDEVVEDSYGGDWDDMTAEDSHRMDNGDSRETRHVILGSVMGDNSCGSSVGQGSGDRKFGSYGGDTFDQGADNAEKSEESPHAERQYGGTGVSRREQGHGSCLRAERPDSLSGSGKAATYYGIPEQGCPIDACKETLGNNRADDSVNVIDRERPRCEDSNSRSGNEGNHATDKNTGAVSGDQRRETQRPPAVPNKPIGTRERIAATQSSGPTARWPSPQSVQLSHGYIFYAREAGDYAGGSCPEEGRSRGGERRRRGASRRGQKPRPTKRQSLPTQSPQNEESETVIKGGSRGHTGHAGEGHRGETCLGCDEDDGSRAGGSASAGWKLHEIGDSAKEEQCARRKQGHGSLPSKRETCTSDNKDPNRGDGMGKICRINGKEGHSLNWQGRRGSGCGYDLSGGLPVLERDVRGAMVAVWLAWGVRIDAAREKLRQEERWLEAAHRTEIAKLGRYVLVESSGGKDIGITPEVLECVAKDAALRECGDVEQADRVRREASRARTRYFAARKDVLRLRRPLLQAALRQQQVAEERLVRSVAEKNESKLVRARDETVRLLQLHLSRARRLVSSGVAVRATSCRPKHHDYRRGELPVLLEADLLKLGKVLLLAQDTAHYSIERALRLPEGESAGDDVQTKIKNDVVAKNQSTCGLSQPPVNEVDDEPSAVHGKEASSPTPFRECISCDVTRMNGVESARTEMKGPSQGRHNGDRSAASSAVSRPKRSPQVRISNRADTNTTSATVRMTHCLWCNPPPTEGQQRCQGPAPTKLPQRRNNRRLETEHPRPYAHPASSTEALTPHHERLQTRQSRLSMAGRLFTPSNQCCPQSCNEVDNHAKVSKLGRIEAESSAVGAQLRVPLSPPGGAVGKCTEMAATGVPGTTSERDCFCSPEDVIFDGEHRLLIRGGGSLTAPHSHFCSWECAGRWNASFSPTQTRHERGLKIDIAAGRIVPK